MVKGNRRKISYFLIFLAGLAVLVILFTRGTKTSGAWKDPGIADSGQDLDVDTPVRAVPDVPPFREFAAYMDSELDSSYTVGAAYTLVHGGEVCFTRTFGERKKGSGLEIDDHTLFRLASVSKGFAGALACMLDQEGVLSLDDRVVDHYPGFRLKDSASTADMTVRNLLSHTTGLVPFAFDNLVEAGEELSHIVERLDEVEISGPPGTLYGYQNVTFSMFDPIVRRVTGTPYEVLVARKIFEPLGMEDACVGPAQGTAGLDMACPHIRGRGGYIALDPHEGYYNVLPAAGVSASISDMGQWLLALLGNKPGVFPDTIREMLAEPVIYTPLKYRYTRYWKPFRERYYSLGWRIYLYRGRKIMYHGGYIQGYRAEIGICPEEDVGIAFLQNSPNSLASKVVPGFFDLYFDYLDNVRTGGMEAPGD